MCQVLRGSATTTEAVLRSAIAPRALWPTLPDLTRLSLHRCPQRHGVNPLPETEGDKLAEKSSRPIGGVNVRSRPRMERHPVRSVHDHSSGATAFR